MGRRHLSRFLGSPIRRRRDPRRRTLYHAPPRLRPCGVRWDDLETAPSRLSAFAVVFLGARGGARHQVDNTLGQTAGEPQGVLQTARSQACVKDYPKTQAPKYATPRGKIGESVDAATTAIIRQQAHARKRQRRRAAVAAAH